MKKKIIDRVMGITAVILIYIILCIVFGASGYRAGENHINYIKGEKYAIESKR